MKICVTHPHAKCDLAANYIRVRLEELEAVEDSSCLEVNLMDTADFVRFNERVDLYSLAIKKLRHGGVLLVSGRDLYDIAKNISYDEISVEESNGMLFNMRMSMDHMIGVRDKLKALGLKIEELSYDGPCIFCLKAIRP